MKIYKKSFELNGCYKDGSFAKDKGAAITTNPFLISTPPYYAWQDGWNKLSMDKLPTRQDGQFNTGTTAVDPGLGHAAINNAAYALATVINLSLSTLTGVIATQSIIDLPVGTVITLIDAANVANFAQYTLVSTVITTYAAITVTYGSSAGTVFANNLPIVLQVQRP
jgi:hypothetical protein